MDSRTVSRILLVVMVVGITHLRAAEDVAHALAGTVTKVDSAAKTVAVKTAEGTEETLKFTDKTVMHAAKGVKTGAVDTYLTGKEGTHVVVRYTGEGAKKVAVAVDDLGKDTVKTSKGTVTHVDKAADTITVKTEDGAEDTYRVAKDASVDTVHGVVKGSEYSAKEGEKITVHYTEDAGKKIAQFVKHL
jgi:hypothetical protein